MDYDLDLLGVRERAVRGVQNLLQVYILHVAELHSAYFGQNIVIKLLLIHSNAFRRRIFRLNIYIHPFLGPALHGRLIAKRTGVKPGL
ncbi:hypothetical protein SDC9_206335 [bioreactor metagenome]|uniref:Uncharacterized protein n=1 Tax=bioreactor metagenome TaxID=1076179 RepID=A0A645J4R3_9ZZZZ